MKIGARVEIVEHTLIPEFVGCVGTITKEKLPESQIAILCGNTSWQVQLDTPLEIYGERIESCEVREDSLALI